MNNKNKVGLGLLCMAYIRNAGTSDPKGHNYDVGYDWGLQDYNDISKSLKDTTEEGFTPAPTILLPDRSIISVFNTVSSGETLWNGKVQLEYERGRQPYPLNPQYGQQAVFGYWVHGFEKTLQPEAWGSMFFSHLPAKLERDGVIKYGALEPFFETGTEGIIWSVMDYSKTGYDALNPIKSGDNLTVYSSVQDGEVFWSGPVDFEDKPTFGAYFFSTEFYIRTPEGISPPDLSRLAQHLPCKISEPK